MDALRRILLAISALFLIGNEFRDEDAPWCIPTLVRNAKRHFALASLIPLPLKRKFNSY